MLLLLQGGPGTVFAQLEVSVVTSKPSFWRPVPAEYLSDTGAFQGAPAPGHLEVEETQMPSVGQDIQPVMKRPHVEQAYRNHMGGGCH